MRTVVFGMLSFFTDSAHTVFAHLECWMLLVTSACDQSWFCCSDDNPHFTSSQEKTEVKMNRALGSGPTSCCCVLLSCGASPELALLCMAPATLDMNEIGLQVSSGGDAGRGPLPLSIESLLEVERQPDLDPGEPGEERPEPGSYPSRTRVPHVSPVLHPVPS